MTGPTEPRPSWAGNVPSYSAVRGPLPAPQWDEVSQNTLDELRLKLRESIMQAIVLALKGFFVPGALGTAFDQLSQWAEDIPVVGDITAQVLGALGDLADALQGTYEGDDQTLQLIQTVFTPVREIVTALTGIVGNDMADFAAFLGGLDAFDPQDPVGSGTRLIDQVAAYIIEAIIGTPGDLEKLKTWVETNIPGMDVLVSTITGETTGSLDITQLGTWAKTILTSERSVPAAMLSGSIPGNVFGTLPVSHISITNANLLSQGDFAATGTITAGSDSGWAWDGNETRTGEGSGSAKVSCNSTLRVLYSNQTIPVVGKKTVNGLVVDGDKLRLSAYVKTSSGFAGSGSSINLAIIPFIGTAAQTPVIIAARGSTSNQWLGLSGTGSWVVPENVTSVRVRLAVTADATAGSVWFDDVDLSKDGLLGQGLVEYLTDAWDDLIRASLGIPSGGAVNAATIQAKIQSMFSGFSSIGANAGTSLTLATNATTNLQTFLSNTPAQNFAALGQTVSNAASDIGTFLSNAAAGTAATVGGLVNGAISNATKAVTDFGSMINNIGQTITGGIVSTAEHVGQAISGAIQGTLDTWNNFWGGVFGGTHTGKTAASVTQAAATLKSNTTLAQQAADQAKAANVSTNLAIYKGYFGSGGSGIYAEAQAVMEAIKVKIDKGYTLQTLTFDSGTKKQDVAVFNVLGYTTSGTLTLAYQGANTAGIAATEAASTVQDKLQRLSTIGTGNATVSYSVVSSNFPTQYNYQTTLVPLTQTVTLNGAPEGGSFTLTYKGQTTTSLPYNATAAQVDAALVALNNTRSGASLSLDGSGDYLVLPWREDFNLSSGDWTIESFFKLTNSAGGVIISNDTYGQSFDWYVNVTATAAEMATNPNPFVRLSTTHPTLALNTWHHIAYVRQSGTVRCYINGVQRGSLAMTNTNLNRSNITIGCTSWNNPASYFNGRISNLRIVKGTALYPNGTTFTPSASPLIEVSGTVMLLFRGGAFTESRSPYARYGDAAISTDSPFNDTYDDITVTGSAGGPYTLQFSPALPSVELVTATSSLTGGVLPTITVSDNTVYGKITGNVSGMTSSAQSSSGDSLHYVASLPYWTRPFDLSDPPKEFYAIGWGSGGGGQVGARGVSTATNTNLGGGTSYGAGGGGGTPGGFQAVEIDASQLPAEVPYRVAAGGNPNYSTSVLAGSGTPVYSAYSTPAETNFGTYMQTAVGVYTVVNLLGYYTSNQSSPGAGGVGGNTYYALSGVTYRGNPGAAGASTPLASGGAGGAGTGLRGTTTPSVSSTVSPGSAGGDALLTGKSRAGGGGGGGGGGSWAAYQNGWLNGYSTPGGLGGNGGRPGGGGGGGGSAYTYDVNGVGAANIPNNGIAAGNGGYGGHGIIVLLWK